MKSAVNFVNRLRLVINLMQEGGEDVLAMLFATRIVLGTLTFAEVPARLKPAVKDILTEMGVPELAEEGE